MNTRQQEYILAIFEEQNMQRASERLFISQSTLSQTLLKLEKELGCQLFIRTPRKMLPTEVGRIYIEGARQSLDIKHRTYQKIFDFLNERKTSYRIGVSSHEGIERFLEASSLLQKEFDGIEIYAIEDTFKNLIQKLRDNYLDLLIVTWNSLEDIPMPFQVLSEEEIFLVSPKGKFSKTLDNTYEIRWDNLKNEKMILPPPGTALRNMTDSAFNNLPFTPKVLYEINNVSATLRMVQEKNVIAFLPKGLCSPSEDLDYFSLDPRLIRYQIIVYCHSAENDPIMQIFIQQLHHTRV